MIISLNGKNNNIENMPKKIPKKTTKKRKRSFDNF